MSFGTPVVPPESWNIAGSVGSIRSLRSSSGDLFGGLDISSVSERKPRGASPSTMPSFTDAASPRTRPTIFVKSKSPYRSGVKQVRGQALRSAIDLHVGKTPAAVDNGDPVGESREYDAEFFGERLVPPVALLAVALRELGREWDDACQHAGQ